MAAILLASMTLTRAENLLKNGDFSAGAGGSPADWLPYANKQTLVIDSGEINGTSKQSLRVDIETEAGKSLGQIVQKVPVTPNTKYLFQFDMKSTAPGVGVGQIKLLDGSKELKRIPTGKSTTAWQTIQLEFDSAAATMVWVVLRYDQEGADVGKKVWYANASLTQQGAAGTAPATAGPEKSAGSAPASAPAATPLPPVTAADAREPSAVPTYECVGLRWKPAGGATDNACSVSYRASGEKDWREAMPLWFDPNDHPGSPENSLEYRGSIIGLKSGTDYEVKLNLAKGGTEKLVKFKTWSDSFPVAKTVTLTASSPQPLVITEGGSKEKGFVVYTSAPGVVLDGKDTADNNIEVNAPFVILRGLTMKNAKVSGVKLGEVQDVVIEDCDISGWGRIADGVFGANLDAAIYSKAPSLERITIQKCRLHHPRSNANSWTEERMHDKKMTKHPIGPQGITFIGCKGNLVIRHNKIYSDAEHKFNDGMGETHNFSYGGFPNRDSDIYDNDVSNVYDDGVEIEGADLNVRIWGNRFDDVYGAVGAATSSLGPLYIFRNVMNSSRKGPKDDSDSNKGAYLVKLGTENEVFAKGKIYIFHNTMLQPPARPGNSGTSGGNAGLLATGPTKHQINITSRNNILYVREGDRTVVKDYFKDPTNDYDYDLYNGTISAGDGAEKNGIKAAPQYDTSKPGQFPLKPGSPGVDAGVRIPNFNDDFGGKGPDVGAFESH